MKKAILISIPIILLNIGNSYSGIIYETENNSTLSTAQLIQNESFSAGSNENIYNSTVDGWTWVSILGSGDGTNFSDDLVIRFAYSSNGGFLNLDRPEDGLYEVESPKHCFFLEKSKLPLRYKLHAFN